MRKFIANITLKKTLGVLAIIGTVGLQACTPNFFIGDAISTIATEKTLGDHAISYLSNKDCSIVRKDQGLTYCKEDDPQLIREAKVYCYNELGKVTCYKEPDHISIRAGVEDRKEAVRKWK
jgi:hypothetical protein